MHLWLTPRAGEKPDRGADNPSPLEAFTQVESILFELYDPHNIYCLIQKLLDIKGSSPATIWGSYISEALRAITLNIILILLTFPMGRNVTDMAILVGAEMKFVSIVAALSPLYTNNLGLVSVPVSVVY